MRDGVTRSLLEAETGDLLTTGEAARILGSSRQHVVDLCERGDLPFVTVGSHRRIRRMDVEALRTRTLRFTRDQRRSLWLSFAVAGRIARDPEAALRVARHNLEVIGQKARGSAKVRIEEWNRLLKGPVQNLLIQLTSSSPKGRELRQNSPFAGVLDDEERGPVLEAWAATEAQGR